MVELAALIMFMIICAVIAVEAKSLLSAVVAVGAAGMALSAAFFLLEAPEVAITQFVAEIIVLVILVKAFGARTDESQFNSPPKETFAVCSLLIFVLVFGVFAAVALKAMPQFGQPLMLVSGENVSAALGEKSAGNIISTLLGRFRSYDMLGAITALFAAVVGAFAVLRKKGRKKESERDDINN